MQANTMLGNMYVNEKGIVRSPSHSAPKASILHAGNPLQRHCDDVYRVLNRTGSLTLSFDHLHPADRGRHLLSCIWRKLPFRLWLGEPEASQYEKLLVVPWGCAEV